MSSEAELEELLAELPCVPCISHVEELPLDARQGACRPHKAESCASCASGR